VKDYFSDEILKVLFNQDSNGCLIQSESYDIEYKLNFNVDSDIVKTMNGLANNRGGYIIFGINPNDRSLSGLNKEKLKFYNEKIDSEDVRGRIISSCQPNIEFKHFTYALGMSMFILFYVNESNNKPHIFDRNMDTIKPGDIFYRYNDSIKKFNMPN